MSISSEMMMIMMIMVMMIMMMTMTMLIVMLVAITLTIEIVKIYSRCHIRAHPPAYKVTWRHNVSCTQATRLLLLINMIFSRAWPSTRGLATGR